MCVWLFVTFRRLHSSIHLQGKAPDREADCPSRGEELLQMCVPNQSQLWWILGNACQSTIHPSNPQPSFRGLRCCWPINDLTTVVMFILCVMRCSFALLIVCYCHWAYNCFLWLPSPLPRGLLSSPGPLLWTLRPFTQAEYQLTEFILGLTQREKRPFKRSPCGSFSLISAMRRCLCSGRKWWSVWREALEWKCKLPRLASLLSKVTVLTSSAPLLPCHSITQSFWSKVTTVFLTKSIKWHRTGTCSEMTFIIQLG